MADAGTDVATRARYLAMAQGTNAQIAAGILVEYGYSMLQAHELVAAMSEELQMLRWAGQMRAKERTYRLMLGEDLGKISGAHIAATEMFARGYLGLGEREEVAKLIEEAQRKLAKDTKGKGLRVA